MTPQTKPGRLTARYIRSLMLAGGDMNAAIAFASSQRWIESETVQRVLKASVSASTTDLTIGQHQIGTDLAPLVNSMSVIGRLRGFLRVPPRVGLITQTGRTSAAFVGEGAAVPFSSGTYSRTTLGERRVAAISMITRELAKVSSPSAEEVIARDLARAVARKTDEVFLDPLNAGSPEQQPASVTRHAPQFTSTGTAVANIDADLRLLLGSLADGGSDLQNVAFVMNPRSATYLASLRGSGGSPCFPAMGSLGGSLYGLPCITSAAVTRSGSPQETSIFAIDASRIWLVNEDRVDIAMSATVELEASDTPTNNSVTPTATTVISTFQSETMAIKAVAYVNWETVDAASAAAVLTAVNF